MQNKSRVTDMTLCHWVSGSQDCVTFVFRHCRWHDCAKYRNHSPYITAWRCSICEFL